MNQADEIDLSERRKIIPLVFEEMLAIEAD